MKVSISCRHDYSDEEVVYLLELVVGLLQLTLSIKQSQLVPFIGLLYGSRDTIEVDLFSISSRFIHTPTRKTILTQDVVFGRNR